MTVGDAVTGAQLRRAARTRGLATARSGLARLRALTLAERVVYASTCLYAALFAFFAVVRYLSFQSQRDDLGNMTQAIWSTLHGRFLENTSEAGTQFVRLGSHVDPFLALLAPLWWVWSSPTMLLTLQALAVSAGALPVFWLARKHLQSERAACFFALAYLLFPATQFNAFAPSTGFHSVSIAMPLLLFAVWFLDEERPVAFGVVALLAATTKEEIPLVVGLLGLWYARRSGAWRFGVAVFGLGLVATLVNFLVVIPHFLGSSTPFGNRYATVGGTPSGVVHTALTDPIAIVRDVATVHKIVYLLLLFAPLLFLWLLEPVLMLAALPDLAVNLLSAKPEQTSLAFHYTAGIVPFLFAGAIFGLARFRRHVRRVSLYVLAAVALTSFYSPLVLGVQGMARALPSNPDHRARAEALSLIPAGAAVSASDQLGAYLSQRHRILLFPFATSRAEWVVVDRSDPSYPNDAWYRRRIDALGRNPGLRPVYSSRGVLVFHRVQNAR
jgi:uncharacterized membrane protein